MAANRLNALKSTGPRTPAGKYRSSLNGIVRSLVPEALEREIRARGEDPRDFCRLQRDLIAIFRPRHPEISIAVTMLATAWWHKARRIRQWIGSGEPRTPDLDSRIEALLVVVVGEMKRRNRHWQTALFEAIGGPVGSPSEVRREIEARLRLFGAKSAPVRRQRAREPNQDRYRQIIRDGIEDLVREIIAEKVGSPQSAVGSQQSAVGSQESATRQAGGEASEPNTVKVI